MRRLPGWGGRIRNFAFRMIVIKPERFRRRLRSASRGHDPPHSWEVRSKQFRQMRNAEVPCRPSQPVRSPPLNMPRPLKTARYRGISQIPLGLRVGNWATEVPFRPLVSEAAFWCLVFAGRLAPGPASTTSRGERCGVGEETLAAARRVEASHHRRDPQSPRSFGRGLSLH
jgi:hypothetical protein